MHKTPANAGYYMPAEWEEHEGTWLQWPQNKIYTRYELKLEGIWLTLAYSSAGTSGIQKLPD